MTASPFLRYLRTVRVYGSSADFEAETDEQRQVASSAAAAGSVFGAVALITGSSVGAGILALPEVSAPAGFVPSSAALVACWGLLTLEALVMAEVNVAVGSRDGNGYKPTTLTQAASATLGSGGSALATGAYLLTSYTMLVAYMCKGNDVTASILSTVLDGCGDLPPQLFGALFAGSMSVILSAGDTETIDKSNRWLTACLLGVFLYIVVGGASAADFSWLAVTRNWEAVGEAMPILFLALVYHDLVPLVCSYLGGDLKRIRQALVIGGSVPLTMFLSWNAVALSMAPPDAGLASVEPLLLLSQQGLPMVDAAVSAFSLLAIATSFIGTFLGLTTYLELQLLSVLHQPNEVECEHVDAKPKYDAKVMAFALAISPSLAVYWFNSDGFLAAAQFAGAYGMTTLYALLPPLMAWRLMSPEEGSSSFQKPRMLSSYSGAGGRMMLASMAFAAVGVESLKAALDAGISLDRFFSRDVDGTLLSVNAAIPDLAYIADLFRL